MQSGCIPVRRKVTTWGVLLEDLNALREKVRLHVFDDKGQTFVVYFDDEERRKWKFFLEKEKYDVRD